MTRTFAKTFLFRGDQLLLEATGELVAAERCPALGVDPSALHAVVGPEAETYGTTWLPRDLAVPAGLQLKPMRALYAEWPAQRSALAAAALQVAEWARTHRYCGVCATPTQLLAGERCMRCPACGHVAYPRISPVMMVLIRKGEKFLLARPANTTTGRFSALAGFLEAGETIEQAVHREVMEEVGLKVHNLRYFESQSWPFPHSLMIAYTADYLSGEITPDPGEIGEADWFGPTDPWPPIPDNYSIAGRLIRANAPFLPPSS